MMDWGGIAGVAISSLLGQRPEPSSRGARPPLLGEMRAAFEPKGRGSLVERPMVWNGEQWIDMLTPEYRQLQIRLTAPKAGR